MRDMSGNLDFSSTRAYMMVDLDWKFYDINGSAECTYNITVESFFGSLPTIFRPI